VTLHRNKSLLVLFFRKEQDSSFSEEKEAKRLLSSAWLAVGLVDEEVDFLGL
jgi:hypothetical protein